MARGGGRETGERAAGDEPAKEESAGAAGGSAARPTFEPPSVRDHLANERTLLAWVRTALTIIGLGFIVDRLALTGDAGRIEALAGVGLVVLGGAIALGGAWSFLRARREMEIGSYRPAAALDMLLVAAVVAGAVVVAVFLLTSRPV